MLITHLHIAPVKYRLIQYSIPFNYQSLAKKKKTSMLAQIIEIDQI
jgi:hypothetical protein